MKKILLATALSLMSVSAFASMALTVPQNTEVKSGQTATVKAMYQYSINNTTSTFQNYVGFEEIEVNGKKNKYPISFGLAAHGVKNSTDFRTLNYKTSQKGKFTIKSSIKIMGMTGAVHTANATLTVD